MQTHERVQVFNGDNPVTVLLATDLLLSSLFHLPGASGSEL